MPPPPGGAGAASGGGDGGGGGGGGSGDGDEQVRLALGDVLRDQEVEQRLEQVVELVEATVVVDERDNARIGPGQWPKLGLVVRVREEAEHRRAGRHRASARA